MRNLSVEFAPVDRLNPKCGYSLRIEDTDTRTMLLFTSKHPVSGEPLNTAADCLAVVQMYVTGV